MEGILSAIFTEANEIVLVAMGVFARVGAVAFLLPGLGERGLSLRLRLGGALALPKDVTVARSIEIDAMPDQIFPHVNSLKAGAEWSPWLQRSNEILLFPVGHRPRAGPGPPGSGSASPRSPPAPRP